MKVRKAIRTIAALGSGALFLGATMMGAMAADLKDYPKQFITADGKFDGLVVVGKNAAAVDTLGVGSVMLGLADAAVTKTTVCTGGTGSSTTVTGEKIDLSDGDLNLGEDLQTEQDEITDSDLPNILATAELQDSQGENKEDVEYDQTITLSAGAGELGYFQDDDDADPSGFYLLFPNDVEMYTYVLEFDSSVDYADTADLVSTSLEMQGKTYTITDVDLAADDAIEVLTLMSGESVLWIEQDQTVTKQVGSTSHSIKMVDVTENEDSCGFQVDGTSVWIDLDETETVNGVTIGVTEAKAVHTQAYDKDICKVFIGADEIELDSTQSDGISVSGEEIDGSAVTFDTTGAGSGDGGTWDGMTITYTPDDDTYLAENDEIVDPVFGNFKFIMGATHARNEEIVFEASGNEGTLTFNNADGDEIVLPIMTETDDTAGDGPFYLGDDETDVDAWYYLDGETCTGAAITDCEGAHFLAVDDANVVHVIEITDIDVNNEQISFRDVTSGSETTDEDLTYDGTNTAVTLRGFDTVNITADSAAGTVEFTAIDNGDGYFETENEGQLVVDGGGADTLTGFTFTETDQATAAETTIALVLDDSADDELEVDSPTIGAVEYGPVDMSDDDTDTNVWVTAIGTVVTWDSDNQQDLTITTPDDDLYADAFIAEVAATSTASEGGEGCTVSTTPNPIPSSVQKFDSEVMSSYMSQNVIAVGGPCANQVTAALLGNPEVCYAGFEDGKAIIQLVEQGNNKVAVIVAGGGGEDTRAASTVLRDYSKYGLMGTKMLFTTSSMKVEPFTTA